MSAVVRRFPARLDTRRGTVDMTHGSGGRAMAQLIEELFVKHFDNALLRQGNDQAVFEVPAGRLVMSTDGHVVSPLFFPGGDIGDLAVNGTVNDLAVSGARPRWLSAGFILEEGFPVADLERIVASMAAAAWMATHGKISAHRRLGWESGTNAAVWRCGPRPLSQCWRERKLSMGTCPFA